MTWDKSSANGANIERINGKQVMKLKFRPGERVAVADINAIKRYGDALPLVGWVDRCEAILNGKQHVGWWVYIRPDKPEQPTVRYLQDEVSRIEVKCYGRLLRNKPSISCPWCIEHGRDLRWPAHLPSHPDIPECTCWWHTHEEHMPECPFGGKGSNGPR